MNESENVLMRQAAKVPGCTLAHTDCTGGRFFAIDRKPRGSNVDPNHDARHNSFGPSLAWASDPIHLTSGASEW